MNTYLFLLKASLESEQILRKKAEQALKLKDGKTPEPKPSSSSSKPEEVKKLQVIVFPYFFIHFIYLFIRLLILFVSRTNRLLLG
jgi:hypothetical protein